MDPESAAFIPRDDVWRVQTEMLRMHQTQADLADRVSRLERRQDEDTRLKNVWRATSPFPSVLAGTPQQVPLQQPTSEPFSTFDSQSSNLIGNLHLDADDEPRRIGATSRANSVRFDETANQAHWAHTPRSSLDLIPRTGSGLGGHAMSERSYSHKSDGRQSSAGHSVHSMTSGRANSFTSNGPNTPLEAPAVAPGLFILGTVPAIIRCWLSTNFKHDTLLYAAVCSGSYASFIDIRLINHLGFEDRVVEDEDGQRKIKLSVYLPEAVPLTSSTRASSPAPQLPVINVEMVVVERDVQEMDAKAIRIFLGSDLLKAHNADILFSSDKMTLYDEDGTKLQIPLVRPEDERTFKSLFVTSGSQGVLGRKPQLVMVDAIPPETSTAKESVTPDVPAQPTQNVTKMNGSSALANSEDGGSAGRLSLDGRPFLGLNTTHSDAKDAKESSDGTITSATPRSASSTHIWSNWRRETDKSSSLDWASVSKTPSSTYQRKDTGIKVLKPSKPGSRTLSSTSIPSSSAVGTSQSRFFDDGKRRMSATASSEAGEAAQKSVGFVDKAKDGTAGQGKPRAANPIGGASAFAWLNNGAQPK